MSNRTIGLEFEFLAINPNTGLAINRNQIKAIWKDWAEKENIELYKDKGTGEPVGVIYKLEDGREFTINTDGGVCLVEFSFAPFANLHKCKEVLDKVVAEFLEIGKKHDVALISHGVQPKTPWYYPDLKTEKTWYRSFAKMPYFQLWHDQFHNIAAHQACIGMEYKEIIPVINAMNALGGATVALFANSSIQEYEVSDYHEEREFRWERLVEGYEEIIQNIQGIPKKPFTSFRDYLEYNWSVYLPAAFRGADLHNFKQRKTIKEFLFGADQTSFNITQTKPDKITPNITDANMLNMYIWIQARPKLFFDKSLELTDLLKAFEENKIDEFASAEGAIDNLYAENRNIASQPWEDRLAGAAYCLGIMENIEKVEELVKEKTWEEWRALRLETMKSSMEVDEAVEVIEKLLPLAKEGLEKRGLGEEVYLEPLFERLEKKESPAMRAIQDFEDKGLDDFIESRIIKV